MLMNSVRDDFHAVLLIIILKVSSEEMVLIFWSLQAQTHSIMSNQWCLAGQKGPDGITPRKHDGHRDQTGEEVPEMVDSRGESV